MIYSQFMANVKEMIKSIFQVIINCLVYFIGLFIGIVTKSENKSKDIVVVRTDNIGDFVLFSPSLRYLRTKFRDFQITLILKDSVAALADDCPFVDRIITFNDRKYRRNLYYKFAFLLKLYREKYDICLYPAYSRERIGDEMVLWTSAAQKIALDSEEINMTPAEKVRGDRIYTNLFKIDCVQKRNELENNREFLKNLKIRVDGFEPQVWVSDIDRHKSKDILINHGMDRKQLMAILPGAMHEPRRWGVSNFNLLIERLVEVYKEAAVLIIGSANENAGLEYRGGNILDLCGKTNLKELPGLFERCSVVIGNETGTLHMAIACGVPTVCILGGGHFGRFMPYGNPQLNKFVYKHMDCFNCNWQCRYPSAKCIKEITVEDIFTELNHIIFK
jgi:ADP-heptose:LPS heptosyltransferase